MQWVASLASPVFLTEIMILSHRHKFIFLHLGRTGGRSLTVELAKCCGPEDIITPSGSMPGQNHAGWHRHTKAIQIRDRLVQQILDDYFVFTVERNPWDKLLSNYWAYKGYQHGKGGKTEQIPWCERLWRKAVGYPWSFHGWMRYRIWRGYIPGFGHRIFSRYLHHYTNEQEQLLVDAIFRYEHLATQMPVLSEQLGFTVQMDAREGTATRQDRRHYTEVYDPWSREYVSRYYARDLELLRYEFGKPAPEDIVGLSTVPANNLPL